MKPLPNLQSAPPELQDVLYGFWWDHAKLHALKLPTGMITLESLRWHLDLPYWQHNGQPFQVTPREVLKFPEMYPDEYERTMATDLSYPIIVRQNAERTLILDGVHRLLKAVIEHKTELPAALFSDELIPLILHD